MNGSKEIGKDSNNNIELVRVKCDFCNSNKNRIVINSKDFLFNTSTREYNIVKCLNCNLAFTNPRLKKSDLIRYYSRSVNYDNRTKSQELLGRFDLLRRLDILTDYFNYNLLKKKKIRKIIQFPNFLRFNRKGFSSLYIPKYIKNGKMLDIGCAYGGFLYQMKLLGWNVKGIELNEEAVKYAIDRYGLDVEKVSIEDFQTSDSYDIIYLLNVLEHVESPKKVLTKCSSLLKPKGILVISIPNISGIEVKLFKKYAYTLQLPFHLYHFSKETIINYIKKTGLKITKIYYLNSDRDLIAPLSYRSIDHPKDYVSKFLFRFATNIYVRKTVIKPIATLLAITGQSSRMTIIVNKI